MADKRKIEDDEVPVVPKKTKFSESKPTMSSLLPINPQPKKVRCRKCHQVKPSAVYETGRRYEKIEHTFENCTEPPCVDVSKCCWADGVFINYFN